MRVVLDEISISSFTYNDPLTHKLMKIGTWRKDDGEEENINHIRLEFIGIYFYFCYTIVLCNRLGRSVAWIDWSIWGQSISFWSKTFHSTTHQTGNKQHENQRENKLSARKKNRKKEYDTWNNDAKCTSNTRSRVRCIAITNKKCHGEKQQQRRRQVRVKGGTRCVSL